MSNQIKYHCPVCGDIKYAYPISFIPRCEKCNRYMSEAPDEINLAFGKDGKARVLNEDYAIYCADKETFEKVKEAVEKQTPKKVKSVDGGNELLCPCCNYDLMGSTNEPDHDPPYCFECGQALDWSDTE